ncbi:MAG: hypothetical protein U5L74_13820 [Ideonella sp.]|nr:hypothetical protein [Ideonella sp.]
MSAIYRGLLLKQPLLTRYALFMLLLALPTTGLLWVDERAYREVAIWAKPLKFMWSTALFAATTAWCVGLLPNAVRDGSSVRALAWAVVLTSAFEVAYISLQAAWGQGSHHNVATPLHAVMFGLMALAAVGLTATQAVLAWMLLRHCGFGSGTLVLAAMLGLTLTFVLATVSGFILGAQQPPAGMGLPLVGWHWGQADARPAHFLGVHAQQLFPWLGWLLLQRSVHRPGRWLMLAAVAYVLVWGLLVYSASP